MRTIALLLCLFMLYSAASSIDYAVEVAEQSALADDFSDSGVGCVEDCLASAE